jgi:acyl-CoA thioesterase FadM
MDIEWLGLGTVRMGFIINGKFIHCHSFHHANIITSTYITTASLPLRYEITNTAATASASTLKQVCSTVLSEGGYELRGLQQAIGTSITSPHALTAAGTYYPVISLRLKSTTLDAIVILTAISLLAATANANYSWRVVATATTTGGTWTSAGANSSVEYNLTGTATTGGRILAQGYFSSTNQSTASVDILKEALLKFQLERDGLAATPYELSLIVAASVSTSNVHASMDWEEISR